jgi:hypothetical protein
VDTDDSSEEQVLHMNQKIPAITKQLYLKKSSNTNADTNNTDEDTQDSDNANITPPKATIIDISNTTDSDSDDTVAENRTKKMPAIATDNNTDLTQAHKPNPNPTPYTLVQTKKKATRRVTVTNPDEMGTPEKMDESSTAPNTPTTPTSPVPVVTPPIIDTKKECRYLAIVTVPPSTDPWKVFTDLLKMFLQHIQDQTTKKLHIAPWDPDLDNASLIKKPKDFPDGTVKNRPKYATYFSGYPNPPRKKESKVYLKIRFVTTAPQDMTFELEAMGQELSESIAEDMSIFFALCYL